VTGAAKMPYLQEPAHTPQKITIQPFNNRDMPFVVAMNDCFAIQLNVHLHHHAKLQRATNDWSMPPRSTECQVTLIQQSAT